ncbi:MAG TPA: helix-turn-helix domain-containing GNAT family N-acetyltransferase [Gemmatimonadales bacterium]|nr:helix-turn-helix domain-containing GNAT family N-acetyltransferase [Gemmatimonadales bacterium]
MAPDQVAAVRRFNRFYTRQMGLLEDGLLHSPFSLTEVRVLYEIAHRTAPTASAIGEELGLDPGYLSRLLQRLRKAGLVSATAAAGDRRQRLLGLTARGRRTFGALDARSSREVAALLGRLTPASRRRLVSSMRQVETTLTPRAEPTMRPALRAPGPGDLGWVVQRHGELYAAEYEWNEEFEALVAGIVADFATHADLQRERAWIAELGGVRAGSVFLVRQSDAVAKLRLLLVEPWARGQGLGHALVQACIGFAREAGYRTLTLWTNSVLDAARRVYQQAGFRMVGTERHHSFGHDLTSETWELSLVGE